MCVVDICAIKPTTMTNTLIVVISFLSIIIYSYVASAKHNRKRKLRNMERRTQKEGQLRSTLEDAVSKGKIQGSTKWELHESI
jgi:hypothetical protein